MAQGLSPSWTRSCYKERLAWACRFFASGRRLRPYRATRTAAFPDGTHTRGLWQRLAHIDPLRPDQVGHPERIDAQRAVCRSTSGHHHVVRLS